jgi:hypothetical protein
MFETDAICPYTGLRSFTEEESLYFKGREEDIDQATEQLQRNKFLMLTGASGDGKSSLIYAGIIPNARAGFLKSKYTQWCVADLRPERTPFHNLCKAIARQLDIDSPLTVEAELNHGFSAIIDLYKNSKRHIDTQSIAWQMADERGKAALKRQGANLIILVDQFEEFFTNPENYQKGVPSPHANLVLNLLLETARIALEEDLPIYIVFTMRSDYIGQCAAFRGLPEYIGFSQFFVPRLNRTQLQQVIEEPAILSGNQITRRLTERLIHDLTEGVDQLPILQHALNQVWHAASDGKEVLDLIHYAMVGGMPVNELPDEEVDRFKNWFNELTPEIKACYHKPNLQNVLDTHTNKLYELAAAYYFRKTGKQIADEDAKAIIKAAFICLTKIDQGRAVRNRMTLGEITSITGRPEFATEEVGAVLNIFREPGNTFIRPFILDDPGSQLLSDNDVLDITHESLIRNWAYLEQWAKEEFNNYTISLDFEQQLNRWVESGKSNNFLLPIGPLTYFENWFNTAKPNAHWIARYLPEEIEEDRKLSNAKELLHNAREFVKRSAGKHVITRTVMRYGPKRIVAVLALLALVTLSAFAIKNYFQRKNNYVLKTIKSKSFELVNESKLRPEFSIPLINEQLIMGRMTIPEVIEAINDSSQKIKIATGIATLMILQGHNEPRQDIIQSLSIADTLMEKLFAKGKGLPYLAALKQVHTYSVTAGMALLFHPDDTLNELVQRNARRSGFLALQVLKEQPEDYSDIQHLSLAIENGINHHVFSTGEINQLLNILSPFENAERSSWLAKNYQRDKVQVRGSYSYGPKFNGLYQDLAYLYAAAGKPGRVLQCMDTLLRYPESFYQNDYTANMDNAANIAAVFYLNGTTNSLDSFVQGYCSRKNISQAEFYSRLVSRTLINVELRDKLIYWSGSPEFANLNLVFSSDEMLSWFFSKLKEQASKIRDNNERNLNLAIILKNEGISLAHRKELRGFGEKETNQLFKEAVNHYQLVSDEYLNQTISVAGSTLGAQLINQPRKFLFLYPDYRVPFDPLEPRAGFEYYQSPAFIKFVLEQQLFDSVYQSPDDFRYFELWLADYQVYVSVRPHYLHYPMLYTDMERLALKLEERNANQTADLNILYFSLSEQSFKAGENDKGIGWLKKIQAAKIINSDYRIGRLIFELVANAVANLTASKRFDEAYTFINVYKKVLNRSSLYAFASQMISIKKGLPEITRRMLDSAIVEMNKDNPEVFQPNRLLVAIARMFMDPGKNETTAYRTIKNSFAKYFTMAQFSKAYAFHGNLYKAYQQASPQIANEDKSLFLYFTLLGKNMTEEKKVAWTKYQENYNSFENSFLVYIDENQ